MKQVVDNPSETRSTHPPARDYPTYSSPEISIIPPSERSTDSHQIRKTSSTGKRRLTRRDIRPRHDRRIMIMALASGLPAVVISLYFLWNGNYTAKVQWTLTVLI